MSKSQLFGKLILLLLDEFLPGFIYTEKILQGGNFAKYFKSAQLS